MKSKTLPTIAGSLVAVAFAALASPVQADEDFKFDMVRSPSLAAFPACVPNAHATVRVEPRGAVEEMQVRVEGLPPKTDFDFFVIQTPNGPFGMAWYQGDMESDGAGHATQRFIGRFSNETFIVAPGSVPAPAVDEHDATSNPATGPIHTAHLGLWFNSAVDAAANGCPNAVTPFNGEHEAGVQLLNTSNFADLNGPLLRVH